MAEHTCACCERRVTFATGRENVWVLSGQTTSGLLLELADDGTVTVCFRCLEELPAVPTREDIDDLARRMAAEEAPDSELEGTEGDHGRDHEEGE